MAKDRFSIQSSTYAKYRPGYPKELFDYILSFVNKKDCAWDCATGNGQAANVLADYFKKVEASDISEAQLKNAVQKKNIRYTQCPAEKTPFDDSSFDLITIATAYHWLNWKEFYKEATRVGKNDGVVAAWGYHVFYCEDEAVTNIINRFYFDIIHPFWDKERQYVYSRYATAEFDFAPLPEREFKFTVNWNKDGFFGYLSSWSAVQNYIDAKGSTPLSLIEESLQQAWPEDDKKEFHFPVFMRIGRITK